MKRWNKVIPIVASLKPSESEQGKSSNVTWGSPSITQRNPSIQKQSETALNPTLNEPSVMVELLLVTRYRLDLALLTPYQWEIVLLTQYRWELALLTRHWWELPLLTYHWWELPLPAYFVAVSDCQSYMAYLSCKYFRRWLYSPSI